jgi:VWFA-related protein
MTPDPITKIAILLLLLSTHVLLDAQGRGLGGGGGRGQPLPPVDRPGDPRDSQRPDETPVFRGGVTLVQVDAFVTDAQGNPVAGLTADDFEVLESGRPREISSFAAVSIPIEPPATRSGETADPDVMTNARPEGRRYLIALDEVSPDRALKARNFLHHFIDEQLGPNDVAAVALTGRGLADSGQDFTGNRRLLHAAIDKFSGGFDESAATATPVSSDARQLMSGLRKLTEFLATLPGRKALIYVGEGLGGVDIFRLRDYHGGALTPTEQDAHAAVAAATRGNVTIYPVDPRGLTTDLAVAEAIESPDLEARADLAALANLTGGFTLTGSNNFAGAFERLVRDNSTYYTIGFNSEYQRVDGRFVSVQVRVKRPGLQVRSRGGYVAPIGRDHVPQRVASDTRLPAIADALASPVATSGVPIRVFAAPFRSERAGDLIALAVELEVASLNLTRKAGVLTGEVEISYLATDSRGRVRPGHRHAATLTLKPEAVDRTYRVGVRVLSDFELSPGRYQLRVAAGGATTAGSVVYDLDVPDFSKGALAISGVALTSTAAAAITTLRPRDPLADALPGPPMASRDFAQDDEIALFAEVYDNRRTGRSDPSHTIDVTAELRDERGGVVLKVSDQRASTAVRRKSGGLGFTLRLPLKDVPPGAYTLTVEARAEGEPQAAVRRIPLRVK